MLIWMLGSKYKMRKIRGDGNCFYRGFLFSYLEQLLVKLKTDPEVAQQERSRMEALVVGSKDELVALGYSEIAIETFHDVTVDFNPFQLSFNDLHSFFVSSKMFVTLISDIFTYTQETLLEQFQAYSHMPHYARAIVLILRSYHSHARLILRLCYAYPMLTLCFAQTVRVFCSCCIGFRMAEKQIISLGLCDF